jgi:hypothetical protein
MYTVSIFCYNTVSDITKRLDAQIFLIVYGDGHSSVGDHRNSVGKGARDTLLYVVGSISAVTSRYCTNKIENAIRSTKIIIIIYFLQNRYK